MDIEGSFRRKLGTACQSCKRRKNRCRVVGQSISVSPILAKTVIGRLERLQPASPSRHSGLRRGRNATPTPLRPSAESTGRTEQSSDLPLPVRDETLQAFYERGVGTRDWEVFCDTLPIRIVYIGNSTANLYQFVRTEDPGNPLHYPFPPIKPLLPWRPESGHAPASYLTGRMVRDLGCLPTQTVRDSLIQTYFEDIHPGFPVIDEEEFRRQCQDPKDPPPLLLYHGVLLAAARISDHPMVASARANITATLFRRAKTLFEMRYENDRVHLVQAALLLAWHVENSDTVSCNSYHWVGQATRIAQGLGMHRNLLDNSNSIMPLADRRVYRKCWWAILQAETFTALEYGRPSMIREDDYDQPPMTEADFLNFDGSTDPLVDQNFSRLNASLCELALQVCRINAPRPLLFDFTAVEQSLSAWKAGIPLSHDFWSCLLRINFSLIKLVLHRSGRSHSSPFICAEAASTILTTFETMVAGGTIRKCPFYATTALLAAAIQLSREVNEAAASKDPMRALSAHAQLERLLRPIEALSVYWPNVEALYKLCISLHRRRSDTINAMKNEPPVAGGDPNVQAHIDWAEFMAAYQLPQETQGFNIADWMSSF